MESQVVTRETTPTDQYIWYDKVILVAEDIELNYRYLKELLNPTGAMLVRAINGKDAVEICESNFNIDIVLMDIFMPEMNGYEASRRIRAIRPELPIIAQTAYAFSEERKLAFEAGCNDFIAKPI